MFVAWCVLNNMAGALHKNEFPEDLSALNDRLITPGQFLVQACDEKFTDEELNDEGNSFAIAYFGQPGNLGQYFADYEETLSSDEHTLYHIEDSWKNFYKLSPVIERRFDQWKNGTLSTVTVKEFDPGDIVDKKPWWKLW